jgi:hypothetical protein
MEKGNAAMEPWPGTSDASSERTQGEIYAAGLGDGLPIVPPTADRVNRMLAASGVDPDAVICELPPLFAAATWHAIAINAVMAGCKDEYLAIIGAAIDALAEPEFNLIGIATTTGSAATLVIVNGPVTRSLEMNAAANALGPGNRANASIGRAVRLVLQNVGGATPGEIDMATLGQPAKFTFCLAENEAGSPWPPLHVERGFETAASVVTVVGASGIVEVVDSSSCAPEELAQTFAQSMLIAGTLGGAALLGGGEPLLVLPPEQAQLLAQAGCSKTQFKALVWERAFLPLESLSPPIGRHLVERRRSAGETDPRAPLRVAEQPADIMIVVAGGVGIKAAYIPTWGGSTRAVSRRVRGD